MSWFTCYVTTDGRDGPDAPIYLVMNTTGDAYFVPGQLEEILALIKRFPRRGYDSTEQICAVARYHADRNDQEVMLVFGWGGRGKDDWIPFFKIPFQEAKGLPATELHERVMHASLAHEFPTRVAIGCGP